MLIKKGLWHQLCWEIARLNTVKQDFYFSGEWWWVGHLRNFNMLIGALRRNNTLNSVSQTYLTTKSFFVEPVFGTTVPQNVCREAQIP